MQGATPLNSTLSDESAPIFSFERLAALLNAGLAQGYSNNERQAVARALLRHNTHLDGTHYQTRTQDGLHPCHVGFNPTPDETAQSKVQLVEASLQDVFDAITIQDRLDGGISVLIHCPGACITPSLTPNKIALDVYVTPRELHSQQEQISGKIASMVQVFCHELALPHLHRHMERCRVEGVSPLNHQFTVNPISATGLQRLPPPLEAMGARLQCSALSPDSFTKSVATERSVTTKSKVPQETGNFTRATTLQTPSTIRRRRPAEAFQLGRAKFDEGANLCGDKFAPPLISIGMHSDAVLDRLKLGDDTLLQLHVLLGTVRSSRWAAALTEPDWGLRPEQAALLAEALLKDVQGSRDYTVKIVKKRGSFLVLVLQGLGLLALFAMLKITWFVVMH